jgi:glutamate/tyrosine decarboxylase-like PLP-dependent enzyme
MAATAAYLVEGPQRDGLSFVPEMSRRARGCETWAALKSLGSLGVADLVDRCCRLAVRFSEGMRATGLPVLNDVVLNQVLVSFGDAERTSRVIAAIQREGICWCGGTVWQDQAAMRFSVSSWATTQADIDQSIASVVRATKTVN